MADAPVSLPLTVCGNGVGVLGSGSASCGGVDAVSVTDPGTPGSPTNPVITTTSGGSGSDPIAALLNSAATSLASTGSDLKAVLAFALALLSVGGAASVFARNWSTATG